MIKTEEIYLVVYNDGYDYSVEKIFKSKEMAEEYIEKMKQENLYIEESLMYADETKMEDCLYYWFEILKEEDGALRFRQSIDTVLNIDKTEENSFYADTVYGGRGLVVRAKFKIKSEEDRRIAEVKVIAGNIFSHMDTLHKEGLLVNKVVIGSNPEIIKHMRTYQSFAEQGLEELNELYNREE